MYKRILILGLWAALLISSFPIKGCTLFRAFTPTELVKHPDTPMLVLEVKDQYLRVAVLDKENNVLIEYGWIKLTDAVLKGWTLVKFDWERFILACKETKLEPE